MSFKEKVLVVGSGGCGALIAQKLISEQSDVNVKAVVASDAEYAKLNKYPKQSIVKLDIDGTGKKPHLAYQIAKRKEDEIRSLIGDQKILFHIVGLGGGTGVGTALYIAEKFPERKHLFIGIMPSFDEGREIIKNTLKALEKMQQFGKVWAFDNRLKNSSYSYEEINQRIAYEIDEVLTLPDHKTYLSRDMDTGNLVDLLFSHDGRGIISSRRFEISNLHDAMSIETLRDQSVSFKFPLNIFDKAGIIIKLAKDVDKHGLSEAAERNIDQYFTWIEGEMDGGSFHPAVLQSESSFNELLGIFSAPSLKPEHIEEYISQYQKQQSVYTEKFKDDADYELLLEIADDIKFSKPQKPKRALFEEEEVATAKETDDEDFLDLLG